MGEREESNHNLKQVGEKSGTAKAAAARDRKK